MKKTRFLCLLLGILMLLSSCKSVYEDIPEPTKVPDETEAVEVDTSSEYFTTGSVDGMGHHFNGYYYNGSWIYIESQLGIVPFTDENDNIYYKDMKVQRFVKYNPHTATLSSPCVDPSCSHSPGSGCVMIINEYNSSGQMVICRDPYCDHSIGSDCIMIKANDSKAEIKRSYLSSYAIYGDWMFIVMNLEYRDYGTLKEMTLYNLKTGEVATMFSPEVGNMIMTNWNGNSYYEGKIYKIKRTLDYSDTGYVPGGNVPAINYTPKTVSTLCEFDPETKKITELFVVPNDYGLQTVSNKRFYFAGLEDDFYYSCTRDGKDFRREDVRTIRTDEIIGTYVYQYNFTGFSRYDLTTNTQINYEPNFPLLSYPVVTNNGIYYSTYTTLGDINNSDGPSEDQTDEEWADEMEKIMFSGTAQIWRSDYDGNNMELVFEKENANIDIMFVDDKFAYVCYETDPTSSDYNKGRSVINLETGAITPIPYLEMILPPGYIPEE